MKKISYMDEEKGLEAHPERTANIIFKGDKRNVAKVEKELKKSPIKFGDSFGRRTDTSGSIFMRTGLQQRSLQQLVKGLASSKVRPLK